MKPDEKSTQKNRVTFNEDDNVVTAFRKTDKIEARKRKNLQLKNTRGEMEEDTDAI